MVNPMCLLWDNSSFWMCIRSHTPQNGPFSHVLGCITPFTTFQREEHIPSALKFGWGIHPMYIKLRIYHLIGTLYMLGWVRMPESGVVQVASTTWHGCTTFNRGKIVTKQTKCYHDIVSDFQPSGMVHLDKGRVKAIFSGLFPMSRYSGLI